MLISHSKQFIFIHIYKVAGTSISKALNRYCDFNPRYINPLKRIQLLLGIRPKIFINDFSPHCTAFDIKSSVPNNIFESYFKFGFVRNPWDWQVSLYWYALKDTNHHQHDLTKKLGTFDNYLEWRVNEDLHLQSDFLYSGENLLVDFVGRFENLQIDFDNVTQRLGLTQSTLGHYNPTARKDYKEYYNSQTRELVAQAFSKDIEIFNYSFD